MSIKSIVSAMIDTETPFRSVLTIEFSFPLSSYTTTFTAMTEAVYSVDSNVLDQPTFDTTNIMSDKCVSLTLCSTRFAILLVVKAIATVITKPRRVTPIANN